MNRNVEIGRRGENAATNYLITAGYEILERNWRCRVGEADIICRDGDTIVFVEVKTRRNIDAGWPEEAVDGDKRRKYEDISLCYLAKHDIDEVLMRFDVVSIVMLDETRASIRHHINCF